MQDSDDITSKDSICSSESSTTGDDLPADEDENDAETMHIDDINVGDFAVVNRPFLDIFNRRVAKCTHKYCLACDGVRQLYLRAFMHI